jgi:hypothetical protein
MCPNCARLVDRKDRGCDGCGADLRATRPVRVRGTRVTAAERIRSPWTLYLGGTLLFLLFAIAARGHVSMARAYLWAIPGWSALGMGAAHLSKLCEGLEEFLSYRPLCWWRDDPLDGWVLAIITVAVQSLLFQMFIIHPGMHGVSYWP